MLQMLVRFFWCRYSSFAIQMPPDLLAAALDFHCKVAVQSSAYNEVIAPGPIAIQPHVT
jgi:hypothetical protein